MGLVRHAAALLAALISITAPAKAALVSGVGIQVQMRATVTSVTGGGQIIDPSGNVVRSFDVGELSTKPWNVGDVLSIAWQLSPEQVLDCMDGTSFYGFGGVSSGGMSGCAPSLPAVSASLERADGSSTTDLWDGFESGMGAGPVADLATGEITPGYSTVDGLVVGDCCSFTYDQALDEILSGPGPGECCAAPAFLFASFGETSGSGSYNFIILDPALALAWSGLTALDVLFDVEWETEFTRVPEPAAAGLFGIACLLVARRRRARQPEQSRLP